MIAVVLVLDNGTVITQREFKESHSDAIPRAIACAQRIARAAANQYGPLPDYQVYDDSGLPLWIAEQDPELREFKEQIQHGDENPNYRRRT